MHDSQEHLDVIQRVEQITCKPDGEAEILAEVKFSQDISDQEQVEVVANINGLSPEEVTLMSPKQSAARRAMSVAFSSKRWNSSWDPSNN